MIVVDNGRFMQDSPNVYVCVYTYIHIHACMINYSPIREHDNTALRNAVPNGPCKENNRCLKIVASAKSPASVIGAQPGFYICQTTPRCQLVYGMYMEEGRRTRS